MAAFTGMTSLLRCCLAAALLAAAGAVPAQSPVAAAPAAEAPMPPLVKRDSVVGTGVEAMPGMRVHVYYTGWLRDPSAPQEHGAKFDSSDGKPPFTFVLGGGRVIKGWDQGVAGMKVGGKRTLLIPSYLAYGQRGAGGGIIPPGADLVFDVELVRVDAAQ